MNGFTFCIMLSGKVTSSYNYQELLGSNSVGDLVSIVVSPGPYYSNNRYTGGKLCVMIMIIIITLNTTLL